MYSKGVAVATYWRHKICKYGDPDTESNSLGRRNKYAAYQEMKNPNSPLVSGPFFITQKDIFYIK
jgi:hypothetical protein